MELILHKVCGHPAQQAVTLRRCTPDEAPAVYALQNEVHAAMPHPEWFVTDTLEHITGYITDSLCIGVWQGSRLGAYLIVRITAASSPHNYAALHGCAAAPSGPTGPMPTAPSSTRTGAATACSATCWKQPCRFLPREHHPPRSHRQPGRTPTACSNALASGFAIRRPPRNVRRPRPLPAGKGAVKRKELLHDEMQQLFVVYNAVGAGWKLTGAR